MKLEIIEGKLTMFPNEKDKTIIDKFIDKYKGKEEVPFGALIQLLKDCPQEEL